MTSAAHLDHERLGASGAALPLRMGHPAQRGGGAQKPDHRPSLPPATATPPSPCLSGEGEEAEHRCIPSHGRAPPPPGPFPSRPAPPAMLRRRRERERRDRGALGACGAHAAGRARSGVPRARLPRSGCSLPQVTRRGRSAEGLCRSSQLSRPPAG